MIKALLVGVMMLLGATAVQAEDIALVVPQMSGGKPLMEAIKDRRSIRAFDERALEPQVLSNLLWATWGISSDNGLRVVPTALNQQDMDLYVLQASGAYFYNAQENILRQITDQDLRELMVKGQDFVRQASVHLLFVTKDKKFGELHAGSMYQNAGLYCSSAGLNCVVRASYEKEKLGKELHLDQGREIVISMAVGYPKAE